MLRISSGLASDLGPGAPPIILVNSEAVRQDVLEREKIDPARIELIYNGVDIDKFDSQTARDTVREEMGIEAGEIAIGVVANLIHYKGHLELVETAKIVREQEPGVKFIFIGRDGGMKPELERRIVEYGLKKTIIFTDDRTDVTRLMQAFDIAALASHEEGFSNVVLESMAAGLPMVATRVGGNPEAILDGETGYLVPPRDPAAMADKLLHLIHNAPLRSTMGRLARQRVTETFSMERLIENMENLYSALLPGGSK